MKEVASLTTGAPPGVIIRIDESRFDVMRVVIVGAKETPYENGCFVFDVFVPPQYPAVPPLVHFMTTGRATFRFNANLYREGKGTALLCLDCKIFSFWPINSWSTRYFILFITLSPRARSVSVAARHVVGTRLGAGALVAAAGVSVHPVDDHVRRAVLQ